MKSGAGVVFVGVGVSAGKKVDRWGGVGSGLEGDLEWVWTG